MIDAEAIVALYQQRKQSRSALVEKRLEVLQQYNGETVVPLPELDKSSKPGVANLLALGLDQFSQRIASVSPDITYPSLRPGILAWDEKARDSRAATLGWWKMNGMQRIAYKRARYLLAFGGAPVTVHPVAQSRSDGRDIPHWRIRSPLATYAAVTDNDLDYEPSDYIVCHRYPLSWLQANYPEQTAALYKGSDKSKGRDQMFEVLEYNDADETVLVAVGAPPEKENSGVPSSWSEPKAGGARCVLLGRTPNRIGICNMVFPGRIVLDKPMGHFDTMLHLFTSQAKMAAYEELSMFRSIFPEQWITSHPNAPTRPKITREANSKQGVIGIIENGVINTQTITPGAQVPTAIDRLERASRLAGGIPAEFGGESPSNVRTARRGASVLSSGVDMPLQEYQEIFAASYEAENARAVKTMKAYFGSKPSMFFLSRDGKVGNYVGAATYKPNDTFVTDYCEVQYSFPGSDSAAIPVEIGQRVGTTEMSLQTAREMDPAIEDPAEEGRRVVSEGLEKALLGGLENQAAQGGLDPIVIAKIHQQMLTTRAPLSTVYANVHEQMQKQQAAAAAAQPQPDPTQGADPSQMPGAAVPPGAAAGQPGVPAPPQGSLNLQSLVGALHPANQGAPA